MTSISRSIYKTLLHLNCKHVQVPAHLTFLPARSYIFARCWYNYPPATKPASRRPHNNDLHQNAPAQKQCRVLYLPLSSSIFLKQFPILKFSHKNSDVLTPPSSIAPIARNIPAWAADSYDRISCAG